MLGDSYQTEKKKEMQQNLVKLGKTEIFVSHHEL